MKAKKTIKGELYSFYFQLIPNGKKAKVRYFQGDEWTICDLSEDFGYILLPSKKFVFNDTEVKKLKLTKAQKHEAIDYNSLQK
jgi:hypothetical protein